jgi:hypothetical protein
MHHTKIIKGHIGKRCEMFTTLFEVLCLKGARSNQNQMSWKEIIAGFESLL